MKIQFKEEQKFTQWWLWLILIGIAVFPIIGIYKQLSLEQQYVGSVTSYSEIILFSILIVGIIVLFLSMKLTTEIDENEIRMKFFPFVNRKVSWHEIETIGVVNYGFVGGWGIRLWTAYGTVYNIKGNKGLAIELKDGKRFVIGTQKEEELRKIIENKTDSSNFLRFT